MKLSHSKLSTILQCPMTYYLSYIQGIQPKEEKSALAIGSAVHWGIEHDTEDLSEYYKENGTFKQKDNYTKDQLLAEAMVHGYLKHKEELFDKILKNPENGEKLELIEEYHELYMNAKIKSNLKDVEYHDFVGIIDLLLLTNKGFIILDYKTSSQVPDWDKYLEQLYRYIMLIQSNFPDVPVCKICIVNLRKSAIRQKKTENIDQFLNRLKWEYDLNDEEYVNYHEFPANDINKTLVEDYILNLSKMCDLAHTIDSNKLWFINFGAAMGQYGKSTYYDIFYKTQDAHYLYKISDKIWNDELKCFEDYRDCCPLDMKVIDNKNCLNKYSIFKEEVGKNKIDDEFISKLKNKYLVDEKLLILYTQTFLKENN